MSIQDFIGAAIKGGWRKGEDIRLDPKYGLVSLWSAQKQKGALGRGMTLMDWTQLYLDPEAWKAVAKIKGWKRSIKMFSDGFGNIDASVEIEAHQVKMEEMIDGLCRKGQTLEGYISTL